MNKIKHPPAFVIRKYAAKNRLQLLQVWERAVLATHHFLLPADFEAIKTLVYTIDFNGFDVYCLFDKNRLAGFIGVHERKIEMLFLDPDYFGRGGGKILMQYAISELSADTVDVNEQNTSAVQFYRYMGFETYQRTERDDQGKAYPLLRMRLNE